MIPIDTSELDGETLREFVNCRHNRNVLALLGAEREQQRAAGAVGEHRSVDGVGRLRMQVTDTAYHYWGQRLGYECWNDAQFLREFERDNPAARVKCGGTKVQVGFTGGAKRFSKTF